MTASYATTLRCDTSSCVATCVVAVNNVDLARHAAAQRYGWTYADGLDQCGRCARGEGPSTGPRGVTCPICHAPSGQWCKSQRSGQLMITFHPARKEAAR